MLRGIAAATGLLLLLLLPRACCYCCSFSSCSCWRPSLHLGKILGLEGASEALLNMSGPLEEGKTAKLGAKEEWRGS